MHARGRKEATEDQSWPALEMDLDGTADEAPGFFKFLAASWPGKVYVLTYRDDPAKARADAARLGIEAEVVVVNSFEEKAARIRDLGIRFYFDDMDEVLLHVPEGVAVFKVRNGGNYCFATRQWLYSRKTGRQL
jgi:hypothetical protein